MEIYERIKSRRKELGLSADEVAEKLNVSPATIYRYENKDIKKFPIDMIKPLAVILKCSPEYLLGWSEKKLNSPSITEDYITFPVLFDVAAGFDQMADAIDEWEGETIDIPRSYIHGKKDDYAVIRVKGDSMYPDYRDGDKVLLKKQPTLDYSGQVGVLVYEDCATLKRVDFVMGEDWLIMRPINPQFPPQRIEGVDLETCRIVGVPKLLVRTIND